MALSVEIYRALESIVGERNISADRAILETYRCASAQSSAHYGPYDCKTPLPQAVLLPGSAEEVLRIVRVCNEKGITFKASSTFWAAMGYIDSDYAIQLDMRRMRSIEIDERNMLAIVEPYAIGATVQAEAMKVGLTLDIPGVGCSSSPLASTAGWVGFGPTGWEFFTHFDAHEKATIKGTADFFNDTQRWMTEKKLGVDMGHWNQDLRREDGFGFTQEEHDAMFAKLPQPLVTAYQYKVREAVNPRRPCGSYYRTLTPDKAGQ